MAKKRNGKCLSKLNGEPCVRMAGHVVGVDVLRDRENTHWSQGAASRWTDAAADGYTPPHDPKASTR